MAIDPSSTPPGNEMNYWRRTRRLTVMLLLIWLALTFGVIFFARELSAIDFLGWPLSFYMAAQCTVLCYVVLLDIYVRRMRRLDRQALKDVDGE